MKTSRVLVFATLIVGSLKGQASPLDDLSSPSPDVRFHAAELIRENHLYHATPRAPWDEWASGLTLGEPMQDVLNYLHKKGLGLYLVSAELSDTPPGVTEIIQLDDCWILAFKFKDSRLFYFKMGEDPKGINAQPPPGYTGLWHTYRINGEPAGVDYYHNGQSMGRPETH